MKRLFIGMCCCCVLSTLVAQTTYNRQKRFQVKSGHVEYVLSGMITGTKSLWWDDYGKKFREELKTEEVVKSRKRTEVVKNQSLSIFDGTYYYNINLVTMHGTKLHKGAVPDFSLLGSGLNDGEMEQLGQGLLKGFGGKVAKKSEQVLSRLCDVTQMMGATVHVYKGVPLRSHVKIKSHENHEEAIRFDENIRLPQSTFVPPSTAVLEDISAQVSGDENYNDVVEEEQGMSYTSGFSFETFRDESDRVRRSQGYVTALHDASGGQYSSMWTKERLTVWVLVNSLRDRANWREDFADDGIEYFNHKGHRMAFRADAVSDEETGKTTPVSLLLVEWKAKDVFMQISATPQQSKEALLRLFDQFKF